jgi:hypothetical protein
LYLSVCFLLSPCYHLPWFLSLDFFSLSLCHFMKKISCFLSVSFFSLSSFICLSVLLSLYLSLINIS